MHLSIFIKMIRVICEKYVIIVYFVGKCHCHNTHFQGVLFNVNNTYLYRVGNVWLSGLQGVIF